MSRGRKVGTAYPYATLNRLFAVLSGLLFVCMIWMFWDDYNRPWKQYQRQFVVMQRERAEAELAAMSVDRRRQAELQKELEKAQGAVEQNATKIAELEAERQQIASKHFPAEQKWKFAKASVDAYRYSHDFASSQVKKQKKKIAQAKKDGKDTGAYEAKLEALQAKLDKAAASLAEKVAKLQELALVYQDLDGQIKGVDRQLGELRAVRKTAAKELDKLTQEQDNLRTRIADLSTDWVFQLRNAPFMDFLAPNIKIQQAVLPDLRLNISFASIPTVDRCMTCHVAIDKPGWEKTIRRVDPSTYLALKEEHGKQLDLPGELASTKDWGEVQGGVSVDQLKQMIAAVGQVRVIEKRKGNKILKSKVYSSVKDKGLKKLKTVEVQPRVAYAVSYPTEQPFATHPKLDVYVGSVSAHPMNVFGCRSCHSGLGRATDFYRAVHMPDDKETEERWKKQYQGATVLEEWHQMKDKYWNKPMYPVSYTEAGCVQCHATAVELEPMPWMNVGAVPGEPVAWAAAPLKKGEKAPDPHAGKYIFDAQTDFVEHGCNGCHKVEGMDEPKQGPGLNNLAVKLDRDWTRRWIEAPRAFRKNTRMPHVFKIPHHLDPMEKQPTTAADFGTFLGAEGGEKLVQKYLAKYKDRKAYYSALMEAEMAAITEALFVNSGDVELTPAPEGDVARGKKAFLDTGCLACHKMDDYTLEGEPDKRYGPDLSNVRVKLKKDDGQAAAWMYTWLKNPKSYHAHSRMPDVRLSDKDAADLTAYLMTKTGKGKGGADDPKAWAKIEVPKGSDIRDLVELRLVNFLEGNMSTAHAWKVVRGLRDKGSAEPSTAQLVWLGEKVIAKQGCYGCHEMSEQGQLEKLVKAKKPAWDLMTARQRTFARSANFNVMAGIGVELSDWGNKYLSKLAFGLQKDLKKTHWVYAKTKIWKSRIYDEGMFKGYDDMLRMPWFGFTEAKAKQIGTYVTGLKKRELSPQYDYLASDRNWQTRTWEIKKRNARQPLVRLNEIPQEAWTERQKAAIESAVTRLSTYEGAKTTRKDRRFIEDLQDKLAKKDAKLDHEDVIGIWMMQQQLEGGLDKQWTPATRRKAIVEGRKLIRRHNCRGCHQIEGKGGELSVYISRFRNEEKPGRVSMNSLEESPPYLNFQGERTQPGWLFGFLRNPEAHMGGQVLRRWVTMKMPAYNFSVEEANALTRYFAAVSGQAYPSDVTFGAPSDEEVAAAQKLFEAKACLTCHGDNVTGSRAAPNLELAGPRLRSEWVRRWLIAPKRYLPYTSMIEDSIKGDDGKWLREAHIEAAKHTKVLLHPPSVRKIRKALGN